MSSQAGTPNGRPWPRRGPLTTSSARPCSAIPSQATMSQMPVKNLASSFSGLVSSKRRKQIPLLA